MIVINYYLIVFIIVSVIILSIVKDILQDDPASYVSGASQVRVPAMCEKPWVFPRWVFSKSTLLQNGWLKFVEHHHIYQQQSWGFVFVLFSHVKTPPLY